MVCVVVVIVVIMVVDGGYGGCGVCVETGVAAPGECRHGGFLKGGKTKKYEMANN